MFIILQRKSICRTVLLIIMYEFTCAYKTLPHQKTCGSRNVRSIYFFKVDSEEMNWNEAWKQCNKNRSNLPVICNQNEQEALTNFLRTNIGSSAVWTSGKKTQFNEWKWVDGQPFSSEGLILVKPESHTHVFLNRDRNYETQDPMHKVYYLCQYSGSVCKSENVINVTNGCVKASDDDRSWYDARNQCLTNGSELAILYDDDLITLRRSNKLIRTNGYWLGLRKNTWHWIWQARAPSDDSGEEVKYSNWSKDLSSLSHECISIGLWYNSWIAVNCAEKKKVVCQASSVETTSSTSSIMATSRPTISTISSSTKTRKTTISSKLSSTKARKPTMSSKSSSTRSTMSSTTLSITTRGMSSMSEGATQSTTIVDSQVPLYSGVGFGVVIIIICIIVIILAVRCTRKPNKQKNQSKLTINSEQNRLDISPNKLSKPPANASANTSVNGIEDTRGVYAEILLVTTNQSEDGATDQQPGIVYDSLEFQREPIYQEPDAKRAHTTAPTKVGPLGDIYAMPDSKGHAVTSPGNEPASHPVKVTPHGDVVYAVPVKNFKSPTANPPGGNL